MTTFHITNREPNNETVFNNLSVSGSTVFWTRKDFTTAFRTECGLDDDTVVNGSNIILTMLDQLDKLNRKNK